MDRVKVFCPFDEHETETKYFRAFRGLDVIVPFTNSDLFEYTRDPADANIVLFNSSDCIREFNIAPIKQSTYNRTRPDALKFVSQFPKAKLFIEGSHLMHVGEGHSDCYQQLRNAKIIDRLFHPATTLSLTTNMVFIDKHDLMSQHNIQFTDFLWNRQLLFYTDHDSPVFSTNEADFSNHWYPALAYDQSNNAYWDKTMYELSDIKQAVFNSRVDIILNDESKVARSYVSMNMTRNGRGLRSECTGYRLQETDTPEAMRDHLRTQLVDLLQYYPGYLGDGMGGSFLVGHGETLNQRIHQQISGVGTVGWTPANNAYYDHSTLSIYVETITTTDSRVVDGSQQDTVWAITEKTWEPLIKGHFILPFGYQGMVSHLEHYYGFKMAPFINYDYDFLHRDMDRWHHYLIEVKRVLNMGGKELLKLKQQHWEILQHNRDVILNTGYRNTVEKAIQQFCNRTGKLSDLFPDSFRRMQLK